MMWGISWGAGMYGFMLVCMTIGAGLLAFVLLAIALWLSGHALFPDRGDGKAPVQVQSRGERARDGL
jgi:hypothetical protein